MLFIEPINNVNIIVLFVAAVYFLSLVAHSMSDRNNVYIIMLFVAAVYFLSLVAHSLADRCALCFRSVTGV